VLLIFESCVDSVEAAVASERGGAGRIELCAGLDVAGLTPPIELVHACVAAVTIPARVMIRPRAGQFIYDRGDVDAMVRSIGRVAATGAAGIVTGALRQDATVDMDAMRRLIDAARPLPVVRLVARAGDRVTIIAGGSVRASNVSEIVQRTGVREVHAWVLRAGAADSTDLVSAVVERLRGA
jgi:copper homeostasis protein